MKFVLFHTVKFTGCLLSTALSSVDTFHLVVFIRCFHCRGNPSSPFSILTAIPYPVIRYHNISTIQASFHSRSSSFARGACSSSCPTITSLNTLKTSTGNILRATLISQVYSSCNFWVCKSGLIGLD